MTPPATKVVHVSVVHRADDPRIFERECRSLADAGYEVTYLAPEAGANRLVGGVRLAPLPPRPRSRRWLSAGAILGRLRRIAPRVVHLHDPELLTLVPLLRTFVPRVVYDMHEYVTQSVGAKPYLPGLLRPAVAATTRVAQRNLAAITHGLVAVTDEQFEELGPRPALRITLPNYPRLARFTEALPTLPRDGDRRLRLIYVGTLAPGRGTLLMLDVMTAVRGRATLHLGGRFSSPQFEREVRRRVADTLPDTVSLLGPLPPHQVAGYLASADVVWVPAQPTSQYARPAVATKLFEGSAVGLAALVSDLPGRREFVQEQRCGLVVPPTVEGHLAGVEWLLAHRAKAAAMGARGRQAVRERYTWEAIERRLLDFYVALTQPVGR